MAQMSRIGAPSTRCNSVSSMAPVRVPSVRRAGRGASMQSSVTTARSQAAPRRELTASRRTHIAAVAAAEAPAASAGGSTATTWYALIANAEFFCNDVQNEPLAEQLRERVRYFQEQSRPTDFYLIPNPAWLAGRFPDQAKQVRQPCMALVSTDKQWITFMKLRLDRVLKVELSGVPDAEVLAPGAPLPEFAKPAKWTAPYSAYSAKWWEAFYPTAQ